MKIIIIGAGPGGYETAVEAAKRGIETVIVSDGPLGGTCLNEGCIPTKVFCSAAEEHPSEDVCAAVRQRKDDAVAQLQNGIASLLKNKLITLVFGKASFKDAHTVTVDGNDYSGDAVIIATGSVSSSLPIPGAELAVTSREMLELTSRPSRLCVIGGGVIGLEFASIYNSFGSEVTVLEYAPGILPRFDVDLAKRLKASLSKKGISIETSAQVRGIARCDEGFEITYMKKGNEASVKADLVLMAVGRRPNVESLNLTDIGVEFDRRGIKVDENMETSVPGVYAVGDVRGGVMLAHVATFEGLRALNHICSQEDGIDFSIVPSAVFTEPELATVGMTEEECEDKGIEIKCLKSFYRANGKAVAMGETDGYCKFIVEASTGRILGAHIIGAHASDLVHEAAMLVSLGVTVSRAKDIIHAHPSLSEVLLSALRQ